MQSEDYAKIKDTVKEILDIGDEAKASAKIIELNDMLSKGEAQDRADIDKLNNEIEAKSTRIEELESDNKEIRKINADIMLKYGTLLNEQQPVVTEVEEDKEEPSKTWAEIAEMD